MIPSYRIFRLYPKQVLFATLLSGLRASLIWMLTLLIPFFLVHNLHHSYRYIGHLMLASSLSSVVGSFIILRYTSPHQARKILHFVIVLSLPCLWLFGISITLNIHVMKSLILLGFIAGAIAVLVIRTIFGFFPSSTRLSSVSLCYSYGHTLVSGGILFAILLITELTHLIWRDVSINLIFLYATIFCISTLSAILLWLARHIRHFNNYLNLIKHIQSKHLI
jgi:MFS family permease